MRLRAAPLDAPIVDGTPMRRRPCAYPGARDAPVEERVDPLSYRCRAACRSRRSTSCAPSSAGRQNDRRRGRARSSGRRRRRRGSRRSRCVPSRALCWPARACPGQARLAQLQVLGAQVEAPCSSFSSAREGRFFVLEAPRRSRETRSFPTRQLQRLLLQLDLQQLALQVERQLVASSFGSSFSGMARIVGSAVAARVGRAGRRAAPPVHSPAPARRRRRRAPWRERGSHYYYYYYYYYYLSC